MGRSIFRSFERLQASAPRQPIRSIAEVAFFEPDVASLPATETAGERPDGAVSASRAWAAAFVSPFMTNIVNGWDGYATPPRPFNPLGHVAIACR
jgi:hypothetical protein